MDQGYPLIEAIRALQDAYTKATNERLTELHLPPRLLAALDMEAARWVRDHLQEAEWKPVSILYGIRFPRSIYD